MITYYVFKVKNKPISYQKKCLVSVALIYVVFMKDLVTYLWVVLFNINIVCI